MAFLTIVIGVILLTSVGDITSEYDDIITSTNESLTFAAGSVVVSNTPEITGGTAGSVITSGTILSNSTNSTISVTNYNIYSNGSLVLDAGASADLGASSLVNFTYTSYSDTYIESAPARMFSSTLVILFFAIAILLATIIYCWKKYPELFGRR